jgi:hypothetical protein
MKPLDIARIRLNNICVDLLEKYQVTTPSSSLPDPPHPLVAFPSSEEMVNVPLISPHLSGRVSPAELQIQNEASRN